MLGRLWISRFAASTAAGSFLGWVIPLMVGRSPTIRVSSDGGGPLGAGRFFRSRRLEKPDQIANPVVAVPGMAKWKLVMYFVKVPAPVASLGQVTGSLEVLDDLRSRPFGDSNGFGDVSEARGRVGGDVFEHVRVVGDESPAMVCFSGT
jgi:hypothetical protein